MTVTTIFIIATIVIWIAYDVFAYLKWGNAGTESVVGFNLTKISPGILIAIGYVLGHITWQVHICP